MLNFNTVFDGTVLKLEDLFALKPFAQKFRYQAFKSSQYQSGSSQSFSRGRGMEFEESRHYLPGDEIRHMDWRVTARTGKPHTKVYLEDHEQAVYFYGHFTESLYFGSRVMFKSVAAVRAAALLAWRHVLSRHSVGGFWQGSSGLYLFPAQQNQKNMIQFFNQWIQWNNHRQENYLPWSELYQKLPHVLPKNASVVLTSDFYQPEEIEPLVKILSKRNKITLIHVFDPLEENLPPPGCYAVKNKQHVFHFESHHEDFCQKFKNLFQEKLRKLKEMANFYQLRLVSVSTEISPYNIVNLI